MFLHHIEGLDGGGLVDGDDHGFGEDAAAHEVGDDVFADFEAVFTGDEVVFSGEFPLQLALLVLVQSGLFAIGEVSSLRLSLVSCSSGMRFS